MAGRDVEVSEEGVVGVVPDAGRGTVVALRRVDEGVVHDGVVAHAQEVGGVVFVPTQGPAAKAKGREQKHLTRHVSVLAACGAVTLLWFRGGVGKETN